MMGRNTNHMLKLVLRRRNTRSYAKANFFCMTDFTRNGRVSLTWWGVVSVPRVEHCFSCVTWDGSGLVERGLGVVGVVGFPSRWVFRA